MFYTDIAEMRDPMNLKCHVHTPKFIISLITFILLFVVGISLLTINRYFSATLFLLLGLVFSIIAILSGSSIHVSDTGIRQTFLGLTLRSLNWNEISEIGVVGTKVFNKKNPERTGTLYIYFSKVKLTKEERFKMILKWPPFHQIYLQYTETRFHAVQGFWNSHIETYNIGNLPL